jgi:hypothetical protein
MTLHSKKPLRPLHALGKGFGAIVPRKGEAWAAATVVITFIAGATVGISHLITGTPVPFAQQVDGICLDAGNKYARVSGHTPSAERQRAAIAHRALNRFEGVHPPTELALGYYSLVNDKAAVARLRAEVANAATLRKSTTQLRKKLSDAEANAWADARLLRLGVCAQLAYDVQ